LTKVRRAAPRRKKKFWRPASIFAFFHERREKGGHPSSPSFFFPWPALRAFLSRPRGAAKIFFGAARRFLRFFTNGGKKVVTPSPKKKRDEPWAKKKVGALFSVFFF
jgi:hypothetical protein